MTVQTTTTYQTFAGGQGVLTFNFRTLFSNPNYINVKVTNLSNNTTVLLTYGTNYTVAVNSTGVGGTVTVSPSYGTGFQYTVFRDTGAVQASSYTNFNQFPGPTLENGLDQLTMLIQEIQTTQNLTVQLPIGLNPTASTILPTPYPNAALGWDPTGTFMVNLNLASSGVMVLASAADASGGTQSTHYMTPSTNTIQLQANVTNGTGISVTTNSTQVIIGGIGGALVSSSTAAVTITSSSTQAIISAVNPITISNVPYIKCSNQQASGTTTSTITQAAWSMLTLNTKEFDTSSIATLSSSTLTIPSGTYKVRASCPIQTNGAGTLCQLRVFSNTSNTTLSYGQASASASSNSVGVIPILEGMFTITASSIIILQCWALSGGTTTNQGAPVSTGANEVYAVLALDKVA